MSQPSLPQPANKEGLIALAINAIDQGQIQSERTAIRTFNAVRTTLRRRRDGILSRDNCEANGRKLTKLEESVVTQHILDLDSRGFAPKLDAVADMANKLLTNRDGG